MEQKLKVGNVVVLKSGGPKMTVFHIAYKNGWCDCRWFYRYVDSGNFSELNQGIFPQETLTLT